MMHRSYHSYRKSKGVVWIVTCTVVVLAACISCEHKELREAPPEDAPVTLAEVAERPLCEELTLNGRVACDERLLRKLYIPCTGVISEVRVETGDEVRRGQVLAVMSSQNAAAYQKELSDAASHLRVAERELLTAQELYESDMLSERELATAREEVVRLRAEHERLQSVAGINSYQGGASATIVAPISGRVTAKNVYSNFYVDETNNDMPAFEIADMSRVWIVADVYENDLPKVHEGADVTVTTLAWPDEVFAGQIDKVYHVIDPESKTMKVRITLTNPEGKLVPGIFASVRVSLPSPQPRALTVPSASIIFEDGCNYVVVKHGLSYALRPIEVLHATDTLAWVSGSLHPGEQVGCQNALLVFNDIKH